MRAEHSNIRKRFKRSVFVVFLFFSLTVVCAYSLAVSDNIPKKLIKYGVDMQVVVEVEIKDAKATIDFWIREFFDGAGFDCETIIYKDSGLFMNDFKKGKIDVATSTTLNYLELQDYSDPEAVFLPVQNGYKTVQYLILTRSDIPINNLEALKGKQLAMRKSDDIGRLFLETYLLENGIPNINGFFGGVNEKTQHSQAILSVFFGQSDMCITLKSTFDTMVALNPQVGLKLKAVARSHRLVSVVVFFHKNSPKTLKTIFKNTVRNILQNPRGRQFLVIFKLENLTPLLPGDLDSLKGLITKNEQLRQNLKEGSNALVK